MAEVAYLLGAGASYYAVPTVIEMRKGAIRDTIEWFAKEAKTFPNEGFKDGNDYVPYHPLVLKAIEDLSTLQAACIKHSSIDTYAKTLFLTDPTNYKKLKVSLSFYLTLVQLRDNQEFRYDNFWASVLQNNATLPDKIKIISWNYDFQVEKSYQIMSRLDSLSEARKQLNLISPEKVLGGDFNSSGFGMLKLNGSATFSKGSTNESSYFCESLNGNDHIAGIKELLTNIYYISKSNLSTKTHLYYAWDNLDIWETPVLTTFINSIEILVIIGYSFPFFNRKIDLKIFEKLKKLRKIYIQDIDPERVKDQLREFDIVIQRLSIKDIQMRSNCEQFLFPKEIQL